MSIAVSRARLPWLGLLCAVACMVVLGGCAPERKADVWDQYDIRVPLPAHSRVPPSAASTLYHNDPYRIPSPYGTGGYPVDNDAYYLPPGDINSETYD